MGKRSIIYEEEFYRNLRDNCGINYDITSKPTAKDVAKADSEACKFVKEIDGLEKQRRAKHEQKASMGAAR